MADMLQREVNDTFARVGVTGQTAAILMIVFGILIIIYPGLVAILIGVYLIVVGLLQLLGTFERSRMASPPTSPPPPTYP